MSPVRTFDRIRFLKPSFSMPSLFLLSVIFLLMPLAGCSNDGAGGPVISSLSTPTDTATGVDRVDSPPALDSVEPDSEGVTFDGETDPVITMSPTPTGVTAHVSWDRPSDINVEGYYVYYGKRLSKDQNSEETNSQESSSEEPDSCSGEESQAVDGPTATITGLEPNTSYFFAIRAFNKSESVCSNEIVAVTPPSQS